MDPKRLASLVRKFSGRKILVLGDFVADEYILGMTSRISREAPVLILQYAEREILLGGGGNAAHNLAALGAAVRPVGRLGEDESGREILRQLKSQGMDVSGIQTDAGITPTKTRIMAGGRHTSRQQVVRLDRGEFLRLSAEVEDRLIQALDEKFADADGMVVSDYHYGVLSDRVIEKVNRMAGEGGGVITVDSRFRMLAFRSVTAVTPNEPEVEEALDVQLGDSEMKLRESAGRILKTVGSRAVLITRGSRGIALAEADGKAEFIPVFGSDEIADVTGAGDTVIGVFTLALAAGATFSEAAHLANIGGGIVVMKRGTATVSQAELLQALGHP